MMDDNIEFQLKAAWDNYKKTAQTNVCICQPLTLQVKGCRCVRQKLLTDAWYRLAYWLNQFEKYEVNHVDG